MRIELTPDEFGYQGTISLLRLQSAVRIAKKQGEWAWLNHYLQYRIANNRRLISSVDVSKLARLNLHSVDKSYQMPRFCDAPNDDFIYVVTFA